MPRARVLYFATDALGCFVETLNGFRLDVAVLAHVDAVNPGHAEPGKVPKDWRENRVIVTAECPPSSLFVDVEAPRTRQYLEAVLASELSPLDIKHLTVAAVRGEDYRVTQAIAKWAYNTKDDQGNSVYAGLRYVSKHGDYECWAVFERTGLVEKSRTGIERHNAALKEVADLFGLKIF